MSPDPGLQPQSENSGARPARWWWLRYLLPAVIAAIITAYWLWRNSPPTGDVTVTFSGIASDERPLLLFSGYRDGQCRVHEHHLGTTSSDVVLTAVSRRSDCTIEFSVLTAGRGAALVAHDPATTEGQTWMDDVIDAGKLDLPPPALRALPLAVWIVAGTSSNEAKAKELFDLHLSAASQLLRERGPGFDVSVGAVSTLASLGVVPECSNASSIASQPGKYTSDAINVYYVEYYKDVPEGAYGWNCAYEFDRPDIFFVSWGNPNTPVSVLAHELGHSLGLVLPGAVFGHTYEESPFDRYNVLWGGKVPPWNTSVGQAYAMNFSARSWIVSVPGGGGPPIAGRPCQDSWDGGLCPALKLFVPGWPP